MSRRLENDELKTMINSFRCSDLVSLLGSVGRNRSGRKNELQARAIEILKNPSPDINLELFKRKIRELYKAAQLEAKQTHNLELQQQQMMSHNMQGGRIQQHLLSQHPNSMPQPRPMNPYGPGPVPSQPFQNPRGSNTTVYTAAYPGTGIYNSANQQSIPPAAATPICNTGKNILIVAPPYTSPASNVKFRRLPFYYIKYEILKPTVLTANNHVTLPAASRTSANQEFQLSFVLSCDMASDMAMNRDMSNGKNECINYNLKAQLRITAYDNATAAATEYDDFLPLGLVVRMNQKPCQLPICSPSTRAGTESRRIPRPIEFSPLVKLSPMNVNHLIIDWTSEAGKTFVLTVNLVEKLSKDYLIKKLTERPTISVDITKKTIRAQYKRVIDDDDDDETNADDDDIATTIVRVSLVCPLSKSRMTYPAKGKNCSHLQCFDGPSFIILNEKKPTWMCPVCNRTLYYDDMLIDQYFLDVLQNDESKDCQEVQLLVDGTWKSYDEDAANNENKQRSGSASSPGAPSPGTSRAEAAGGDSIDKVSSNNDADRRGGASTDLHSDANAAAGGPVVDLTEEEEEETPMDVASNNAGTTSDNNVTPTPTPPISTPPLSVNHSNETKNDNITEMVSNAIITKNDDTNVGASTSVTDATSTGVSSSGYVSPQIISLDSPSPPSTTPSSPPNALAALNIEDS